MSTVLQDGIKSELLNLRVTPETKRLWEERAAADRLTLSEYIRALVTEHALSQGAEAESEEEMATNAEMAVEDVPVDAEDGMMACPECSVDNALGAQYCSACGTAMPTETMAEEAEVLAEDEVLAVVETDAADVEDAVETEVGREPWEGVLGTIGSPTSDGRYLIPGKVENRDLPVPFSVQPALAEGHDGALNAGRIEEITYVPFAQFDRADEFYTADQIAAMPDDAVVVFGQGTIDDSPAGQEAKRQIENGADVSLDGLRMDGTLYDAKTFEKVDTEALDMETVFMGILDGEYLQGLSGKIGGVTVVSIGAFEEARVIITASGSLNLLPVNTAADRFAVLVAAAGPMKPPREWFENPNLKELTPLQIGKDGRVSGHLADWNGCHTGFLGVCVPPFYSQSDFAYFNVGELEMAEGDLVPCGKLMFSMDGKGHASTDPSLSYTDIQRYYDDATKVGAFVRAGADRFGTWLAGSLRPGLTEIEIQHLRANPPSGDWRPIRGGDSDLIAAFSVPIPGFPIPRRQSLVASAGGEITAIITAPLEINEDGTKRLRRLREVMGTKGPIEKSRADIRRELAAKR